MAGFLNQKANKDSLAVIKKDLEERFAKFPLGDQHFTLSEFLAIHMLLAYKKSKVVFIQNNYYVNRAEVLHLCNKYITQLFHTLEIYG